MPLPPGSRSTILQTLKYARDPFSTLRKAARRYGDPFTLKLLTDRMVVTQTPEGIREIFAAPPETFESIATALLAPLVGEHSVLLLDGARHKRERALIMPALHGARVKAYGELIQDIALRHAAAWKPGQYLAMQEIMQSISLEVILRAIFGVRHTTRVQTYMDLVPA
jgi:cytochrome P450 family 110